MAQDVQPGPAVTLGAVRSGCEVDYPPFCLVQEDGRPDGFAVELMRAALAAMGREVTFRTGPWAEVKGWLERDEIDALPLVGRTPEREPLFDFTVPYMTMYGAIVVREGTNDVHGLRDLRGRRVAVMKGDNAEEFLRRKERGFEIVTTPTFKRALAKLSAGECDAVVMQRLVALRLLRESGLPDVRILARPIPDYRQDWCFAVTEGDRATLALLNEGLALVVANGTQRRLHAKWFAALELPSDRPIVVGGDSNYPPYEFLDEKGRPAGYNVDLIRAVAQAVGINVEIRLGPWAEVIGNLENGEIDAIQGMLYSPERDRELDFSPAHIVNHCVAVVRRDAGPPPANVAALAGRSIVAQNGDIMQAFAMENGLADRLAVVGTQEDALRAVAAGTYDCALVARTTALYWIETLGLEELAVGRSALHSSQYCFAVPNGSKALLAQLSDGLNILQGSGEYRRIHDKWFGSYTEPSTSLLTMLRYLAAVVLPLLAILGLVLLWSRSLSRQVAKQTQEVRASAARLARAQRVAQTGDWELDLNSGMVDASEEAQRICGLGGRRLATAEVERIILPEYWDGVDQAMRALIERGEECDVDLRVQRPSDGVLAHIRSVAEYDPERRLVFGVVQDVTRQKEAEEELASQYHLLRVAGETMRFGGWSVDLATNQVSWSDTVAEIHGMEPGYSPLVDEGIEFYAPEWRGKIQQVFAACAEKGMPYDEEMEIISRSGDRVWVRACGQAVRDATGAVIRVQGSFQDITTRRQRERENVLHMVAYRIRAAIAEVEPDGDTSKLYHAVVEALRWADFQFDELSACLVDPARDRLSWLGVGGWQHSLAKELASQKKALGEAWRTKGVVYCPDLHSEDRFHLRETLEKRYQHAARSLLCIPFPHGVLGLNSSRAHAFPPEAVAELTGVANVLDELAVRIDGIWTLRETETSLRQAQKMEAIGLLAGGVAHDFNNMLEVIIGHTEFALADAAPTQPLRADLEEVLKAARRSADLTRQLLTFARKQVVVPEVLDLNERVDGILKMLKRLIGENIDLEWERKDALWAVKMDPSQLNQILANLCVNARDAITGVGAIAIGLENVVLDGRCSFGHIRAAPGEYVALSVSDNGCGMDEQTLGQIFEPFFTTKELGKGTGLGLAAVYGIVQQVAGGIDIRSEPGLGTTFEIYLPRHVGDVPAMADEAVPPAPGGTETVLLVEDEVALLKMVKRMLETRGYAVLAANTPEEAIRMAKAHGGGIDLLLTDVIMPEMNGRDLSTTLRSLFPDLRCLFMSGYTADVIAQHGVLGEGVCFIQKPFSSKDLSAKVREALDGN